MTRIRFFVVALLFLLAVPALSGELPEILQPNTTAYSATEVATLNQGITALNGILSDTRVGSRRLFADNGWLSRDFAEYTAGSLAERGYATQLVSQVGWADGVHTWVLVGLPLAAKTAWVPVEASPELGEIQHILGHIPSYSDNAGHLWFEARYLNFSHIADPSHNLAPVAKIRSPSSFIEVLERVKFMALGSYDPDGEILLFLWAFGDGTSTVYDSQTGEPFPNRRFCSCSALCLATTTP